MSAQISSQYVSGVLLAAPLAKAPLSLRLKEDKPISEPYIDMTLGMMKVRPPGLTSGLTTGLTVVQV